MQVLITVKAYPGLGTTVGEFICVAGVRLDSTSPSWIRLWPVGFRELPPGVQFKKWQVVDITASRSTADTRPESYRPDLSTLQLGRTVATNTNWNNRRSLLGDLVGQVTMCELRRRQGDADAPSLGLVKVRDGATARIVDGPVWTPERHLHAEAVAAPHLFRDQPLAALKPPELQVQYDWHCMDQACPGHTHSSCDWEVGAAVLRWRGRYPDVRPHLLAKFGTDMLPPRKDTHFFVGNQHQRPQTFMVLGAFYPPASV